MEWYTSSPGQMACAPFIWCRRGDLNPHRDYSPLDPESSASANSATSASEFNRLKSVEYYFIFFWVKVKQILEKE